MTAQLVGFPLLVLPGGAVMAWTDQQVIYSGDLVPLTDRDPQIDAHREAMVDWLAKHDIDARHVSVPGWIVRDETNRCVVYWGRRHPNCNCEGCFALGPPWLVVVQLESPPLPFPLPWTPDPALVAQYEAWSP